MGRWRVERAGESESEAAARALAEAFVEDPLVRFLAPDDDQRRRWLPALQAAHVDLTLGDGHAYVVRDGEQGGAVAGAICLAPPGRYPPGPIRGLRFVGGVMARPSAPPPRLFHVVRGLPYLLRVARLHPGYPHWYVVVAGVAPRFQGLGAGSALVRRAADLADMDRLPLYLETETAGNVVFYEKQGFRVLHRLSPRREGPDIWTMERGPRS